MSPSDLARLQIAKRAFQATQPRPLEVQTGVRRARLWLARPKPRRNWFSKGLVLVVLALGSLAYAKPQAFADLVRNAIAPAAPLPPKRAGRGAPPPHVAAEPTPTTMAVTAPGASPASAPSAPAGAVVGDPIAPHAVASAARGIAAKSTRRVASPATAEPAEAAAAIGAEKRAEPAAVSEWGRVGRALAQGDDASALVALAELSESGDASTRDKADLGRAQLLMAHGKADQACALANELTRRSAGSHVVRQAHVLLKTCASR